MQDFAARLLRLADELFGQGHAGKAAQNLGPLVWSQIRLNAMYYL